MEPSSVDRAVRGIDRVGDEACETARDLDRMEDSASQAEQGLHHIDVLVRNFGATLAVSAVDSSSRQRGTRTWPVGRTHD